MGKKVLIVEDDEISLKLFCEILQFGGYEVIEARSGVEGVEVAKQQRPDLILMDIQMPEMDGVSALKILKEIPQISKVPVVALTAFAMTSDREKFLAEGFIDYISKPVKVQGLLQIVKKYL